MDKLDSKLLQSMINVYKASNNAELEIRFHGIDRDIFVKLYTEMMKNKKLYGIEKSLNTVSMSSKVSGDNMKKNNNMLRSQIFDNDSKKVVVDKIVRKSELMSRINGFSYLNYVITLNEELVLDDRWKVNNNSKMRFKLRASVLSDDKKWRYDLTQINSVETSELVSKASEIESMIRQYLNLLTESYDDKTFLKNVNNMSSFEVEIEYVGDKSQLVVDDFDVVSTVFVLLDEKYLINDMTQNAIYDVAKIIKSSPSIRNKFQREYGIKQLLNQVIVLTKKDYSMMFPPIGMYIKEKSDGKRGFLMIYKENFIVVSDVYIKIPFSTNNLKNYDINRHTIADCEVMMIPNKGLFVQIFDIISLEGNNVYLNNFNKRLEFRDRLMSFISVLLGSNTGVKINDQPGVLYDIKFADYKLLDSSDLKDVFLKVYPESLSDRKRLYEYFVDGIILVNPNNDYENTLTYKWKPFEDNTIDFYVVRFPDKYLTSDLKRSGKTLFILFVGIRLSDYNRKQIVPLPFYKELFPSTGDYMPTHFNIPTRPDSYLYYHDTDVIDRKICEFGFTDGNEWRFVRVRDDRVPGRDGYGNDINFAEQIFENYYSKFVLSDLWTGEKPDIYFKLNKDPMYDLPMRYNRTVVQYNLERYFKYDEILDLMAGRGGDIHRYNSVGIKKIVAIDRDEAALNDMSSRVRDLRNHIILQTLAVDMTVDYKNIISSIKKVHGDTLFRQIICNFGLHYLCDKSENIANFVKLIYNTISMGGVFMFTVFDGKSVFDLLNGYKKGESWIVTEDSKIKWKIEKRYSGNEFSDYGQMIAVKLPMTDDLYVEPLCNIGYLIDIFTKIGFELLVNKSFMDYYDEIVKTKNMYSDLSDDDKTFLGLYHCVVLSKKSDIKQLSKPVPKPVSKSVRRVVKK